MRNGIEKLGKLTLKEKVRISDPCYDVNTWCAGTLDNVLPGEYIAYVKKTNGRVSNLWVHHVSHPEITLESITEKTDIDVGVDAGCAGIFDQEYFEEYHQPTVDGRMDSRHQEWYDRFVQEFDGVTIIDGKCAISDSGWGDGSYSCYIKKDENQKIIGIHVDYSYNEDDYMDDEEDWGEDDEEYGFYEA